MNICLLPYNNYFNRKLKRYETFEEYLQDSGILVPGINFNPNDDIHATFTYGKGEFMGDDKYDYLVVGDDRYDIVSRWFIIEKTRTRGGQYTFQLLRDVLADYYDYYATAPMYVERAFAATNTPYIYNKENFTVNQIKTSETLLKDKTGCPWIVGYLAQNSTSKEYTTPTPEGASTAIQLGSTLEEWEYYKYITTLNGTTTSNKKTSCKPYFLCVENE